MAHLYRIMGPPALQTALWGSARPPSEAEASKLLALCRAVLTHEQVCGAVDHSDNIRSSATCGSEEVGRQHENA